jgi:hypothetical protein
VDTDISEVHIPFGGKLPKVFPHCTGSNGGGRGTKSDDRNSIIVGSVFLFSGSFSLRMHVIASF